MILQNDGRNMSSMQLPRPLSGLFSRGVQVPGHKDTGACPTVDLPLPEQIVLPMSQHIGSPCRPLVQKGDSVEVGQPVADSDHPVSAPIHSGVSGTVREITSVLLPGGQSCPALVIDSDGQQRIHASAQPPQIHSREDFVRAVRSSGLVGLGGAGFPTHIKLSPPAGTKLDTLLINGAECEPYITADTRECLENGENILAGIRAVLQYLEIPRAIIGVEKHQTRVLSHLSGLLRNSSDAVQIHTLPVRYPQGAEKVLIHSLTGRRVPAGKLPADAGCLVLNLSTAGFLGQYLQTGMPLIHKRLTVAGGAVARPQNVRAIIGTPISDILAHCGTDFDKVEKILMGGPMMGLALMDAGLPVLKQNNGILALTREETSHRKETACIRCGRCVFACPMGLQPLSIEAAYKARDFAAAEKLGVMLCIECGCCSYVCPAGRYLTQTMRLSKQEIRKK